MLSIAQKCAEAKYIEMNTFFSDAIQMKLERTSARMRKTAQGDRGAIQFIEMFNDICVASNAVAAVASACIHMMKQRSDAM